MEFVMNYGLFLAKSITVLIFVFVLVMIIYGIKRRSHEEGHLQVTYLNDRYDHVRLTMQQQTETKKGLKSALKEHKRDIKKHQKERPVKRMYVIEFVGNIKASAAKALRKEVTAVLSVAQPEDEVVVCLENAGGLVHEHGFAASQLQRVREHGIRLTVAVDKVAASGGYMMACVADRIIAAPFAILGSIGVLAQLPNFNRLLDRHGIDFEQIKAGELKRTLTMFGKNTDEDRHHFTQQLEDTHTLFKEFVVKHRPVVEIAKVATGEHWLGARALELKLVDELITSDDYLLKATQTADVYEVKYEQPKSIPEKVMGSAQVATEKMLTAWWQRKLLNS